MNLNTLLQTVENGDFRLAERELPFVSAMQRTPQEKGYHGEGDVWTHTQMVVRALTAMPEYAQQDETHRRVLLLSALLHDIGKPSCTKIVDGDISSPYHAPTGARMAREWLWSACGLSGTKEKQNFRETVCFLIRYHTVPPHADDTEKIARIAANAELAPLFSLDLLWLLSEADFRGRIAADVEEKVRFIRAYRETLPAIPAYVPAPAKDFEIVMMSGLPGTGKDTWIKNFLPDMQMISLDNIRAEFGISPQGDQSEVVKIAFDRARELLSRQTPFVWNATAIEPRTRRDELQLFREYGASVRIVFLETGWEEELHRNANRSAVVPQYAIRRMLKNLQPPERTEAERVEWLTV